MARKKGRVPSPPPPPPPPPPREESSSSSSSSSEEEEEAEATPPTQKAPQNPNPLPADADSSDESSDSEIDAFQLRHLAPSSGKQSESDAQEEDGSSSDSPEPPVQKKESTKPKAEAGKKRQAADSSTPSASGGKAKKAKADPLSGKAKKAKAAGAEKKAPSDLNASTQGKKKDKEKAVPDQSPSKPAVRRWTFQDEIKILEALVNHVKANGTQPNAVELIALLGDSLERKNCSKTEMYEKVRNLKERHGKAASRGILPGNDDELRKFNLSEAIWGESAKEVAAAPMSQNDAAASSKSNKGQTKEEKKGRTAKEATGTVNENIVTESSKGKATKEKVDGDTKGKLSKKAATSGKSKKQGDHEEEMEEAGTTKETNNAATENGGTSVRSKSGKSEQEKKDGDAESLEPKVVTQNDDIPNGETHGEEMDIDPIPNAGNIRRGFDELHNLYPNLTSYVESIQAHHPCGETLKRAYQLIADEKASALESKIKKHRLAEMKAENRRADTKKELANIMIGLLG